MLFGKPSYKSTSWVRENGYSLNPGPGLVMVGQAKYQTSNPSSGSTNHVVPYYGSLEMVSKAANKKSAKPPEAQPSGGTQQASSGDKMTDQWGQSIDTGVNSMVSSISKMISDNQANIGLFMGTIGDLVKQMGEARQFQQQSPYAVTTTSSSTAPTAQTTQPISRRFRPTSNSLAIGPTEMQSAGSGLNIAV